CSFTGVVPRKLPTSIGNFDPPNDVRVPSNFTVPAGNVYKFKIYADGFFLYICNNTKWDFEEPRNVHFNRKEDINLYPFSGVGLVEVRDQKIYVRSAIPKYDTSALALEIIGFTPSSDPLKDYRYEIMAVTNTTGEGAYSDITYIILTETKGGVAPPDTE
ncbi:5699_t:CDS:2, partial [Racocetra persica]